jgi:hypothetical protein
MWITGFYLNSTILRKMKYSDHHKCQPNIGRKEQPYRVWTDDKKSSCIKNENTRLEENINKPNRFIGRTTILYPDFRGKNGEQRRKLFERVKKFIEKQIQK